MVVVLVLSVFVSELEIVYAAEFEVGNTVVIELSSVVKNSHC